MSLPTRAASESKRSSVNLKGLIYVTRAVLPIMLAAHNATIVNVCSGAGIRGLPGLAVYGGSKFAVVGFSESLSQEVQAHGVRADAIYRGRAATELRRQYARKTVGISSERAANATVELTGPRPANDAGRCLVWSGEDGAK